MSEKDQYKNRIELLQGTLDMLILQTLQWGPQHGYGIVQAYTHTEPLKNSRRFNTVPR
jgi:hypothetical protein